MYKKQGKSTANIKYIQLSAAKYVQMGFIKIS